MGTSGRSGGAGSNTSLVPTFLDELPAGPLPCGDDQSASPNGPQEDQMENSPPSQRPAIQPPPLSARFQSARRNFSGFARSGGNDSGAVRRAVRDYVRSGTRGGSNATSRLGAARRAASGALGVFRGLQRDGVEATLRRLNLVRLIGRSAEEIFSGLTDIICPDGGSIDEGIARDAWIETVVDLDVLGISDLNDINADQMQDFFLAFVTHAIEGRLFQDIGTNGLKYAPDLAAIEAFERQLRDYIRRAVRDSFSSDLQDLASLSDQRIMEIVDRTYREAWELLELLGDTEA